MPKTAAPAGAEAVKIERDAAAAGRIRPYHLEAVRDALGLHAATALGYPHEVRPLGEDEPCTKGTATRRPPCPEEPLSASRYRDGHGAVLG